MINKQSRFISVEGIEGVGKTTILQFIREYLTTAGIIFVDTREPGGTPIAEAIRQVLLSHYNEDMSSDTELLLMFAGRAQNIKQIILPALQAGKWVLSDRFTDASFAYQGGGRGVNKKHIAELAKWVQGDLHPDLTILLDAPATVGLNRVRGRGAHDRIELEGVEFFERVRKTYLQLAAENRERFRIINAAQELAVVKENILMILNEFFEKV